MVTLYLDLDGTLIDVRRRHYLAYAHALNKLGIAPLSEGDYWARRRRGAASPELIGDVQDACRRRFLDRWMELVESPAYLRLDTLVPGAKETLASLAACHDLVLVTLRRDRASLMEQLRELGLFEFFSAVHSPSDAVYSKVELMNLASEKVAHDAVVVGDSETDVHTAEELGLVSVCVSGGVRNRRYLEALGPTYVIPSITRLPRVLSVL